MMRALLSRCVAYEVGIPEGRRWFRYHRIRGSDPPGGLVGRHRFHLVAKLAGICLGSLHVEGGADGFWLQALYVRIPYRGLGVGSQLLALAAAGASGSRPPVLLALVEPVDTAALHLFTKAGFRDTGGLRGNQVSLRRDL
jgi:ribosomal protein S18 acetylase RimI-like enzyme